MICPICKQAGEQNTAREYATAANLHAMCHTNGCTCQHKIGDGHLNLERMNHGQ